MTYAEAILEELGRFRAAAFVVGDRLRVQAPPGALPEIAWQEIAAHKPALLEAIRARDRARHIVLNMRLQALEKAIGAALPGEMTAATHDLSAGGVLTNFEAQCRAAVTLCQRHGINPDAPTISDRARTFDAGAAYQPTKATLPAYRNYGRAQAAARKVA